MCVIVNWPHLLLHYFITLYLHRSDTEMNFNQYKTRVTSQYFKWAMDKTSSVFIIILMLTQAIAEVFCSCMCSPLQKQKHSAVPHNWQFEILRQLAQQENAHNNQVVSPCYNSHKVHNTYNFLLFFLTVVFKLNAKKSYQSPCLNLTWGLEWGYSICFTIFLDNTCD